MKEELKRMAIETAYSSKGHYKTADWMTLSLAALIGVPTVTSLLTVIFVLPDTALRIVSFIGLLFSSLALSSILVNNRDKASRAVAMHLDLGNKYLAVYKEIRVWLVSDPNSITSDILAGFQRRISELDQQTSKCKIGFVGRWWAKMRIYPEMDLYWIDKI